MSRRALWIGSLGVLVAWSSGALAYDLLFSRLPSGRALSALYVTSEAHAALREGLLLGRGDEQIEALPSGQLRITQDRYYTQAKNKRGAIVNMPEPWHIHSTLQLTASLRMLALDTTLELHDSVDRVVGFSLSDKLKDFFDWQRVRVRASADGRHLLRSTWRRGHKLETAELDYPSQAVPLEIVGLLLPVAVRNRIDSFELELMLTDGARHRVNARVVRTHDLTPFLKGYPLRPEQVRFADEHELAVVDLWLAAPLKRLFFPHHFYFVYAAAQPTKLLAFWGGDPDAHMQAIRL